MTRNRFETLKAGDRVIVHSFGSHPGVYVGPSGAVSIQGRTVSPASWIKVRLDDGREWNGDFKLAKFAGPRVRAA